MSPSTPSLQGMPLEILDSIIVELIKLDNQERHSLRSLAMVSRKTNDRALPELFKKKTVACRRDVMDSLIAVSNSDRLRHYVEHLTVDLNFSPSFYPLDEWEIGTEKEWKRERESLTLYCEYLTCQQDLFRSKAGNTFLVHCLERLTQVHTVIIDVDRFFVMVPERLSEAVHHKPVGSWPDKVVNSTAIDLFKNVREDGLGYGLFGTFLEAISTTNLNRQASSEAGVGIQTLHFLRATPEIALVMSPETLHHSKLAFSGLKEIYLDIDIGRLLRTHNITSPHKTLNTAIIYELLQSAHGLESLELVTSHEKSISHVHKGLFRVIPMWSHWLDIVQNPVSRLSALELTVGRKCWPRLQRISLSGMLFHEVEFVDLVLRHADTIREISCTRCHLLTGSWEAAIARLDGKIPEVVKFGVFHASDGYSKYPWRGGGIVFNNYMPLSLAVTMQSTEAWE